MRPCEACGYAVDVRPVALLVAGRAELELDLCAHCRTELLEPLERLALARLKASRRTAARAFLGGA